MPPSDDELATFMDSLFRSPMATSERYDRRDGFGHKVVTPRALQRMKLEDFSMLSWRSAYFEEIDSGLSMMLVAARVQDIDSGDSRTILLDLFARYDGPGQREPWRLSIVAMGLGHPPSLPYPADSAQIARVPAGWSEFTGDSEGRHRYGGVDRSAWVRFLGVAPPIEIIRGGNGDSGM